MENETDEQTHQRLKNTWTSSSIFQEMKKAREDPEFWRGTGMGLDAKEVDE